MSFYAFFAAIAGIVVFLVHLFTVPASIRDLPSRCWKCGKILPPWEYHSRKECLVHRIMSS